MIDMKTVVNCCPKPCIKWGKDPAIGEKSAEFHALGSFKGNWASAFNAECFGSVG